MAYHFQKLSIYKTLKSSLPTAALYFTSTGSLLLGQGAQLAGFVVLARYLGPQQFGYLMTITAATAVALSISGLGTEEIMIRRYVRMPSLYPKLLGHSLIIIFSFGVIVCACTILGMSVLVSISEDITKNILVLSIFAVSNILLARLIVLTEFIFIAKQKMWQANIAVTGFAIARALVAVTACVAFGVDRLEVFVFWHGGVYLAGTIACFVALRGYGWPHWYLFREEIWRGAQLDSSQAIINLRQNVDRLVLTVIASPVTVSAYSVASNIVRISLITINSFSRLLYPKLSLAGLNGLKATRALAIKYLPVVVSLGIANSLGLFVIAPIVQWLFGEAFGESVPYLRLLCWLPILVAFQNIAFDALGAAEQHSSRALYYSVLSVFGIGLIALLTYYHGVAGAIAGVMFSQACLSVALWGILFGLDRQQKME